MEQEDQTVLEYFASLGFEEIPIEDGLTALCYEEDAEGEYALVTDEDGSLPAALDVPLMLACYTGGGVFLWSTGFKNAAQFREVWSSGTTFAEKLQSAQRHREGVENKAQP